ncbi:DDE-type integrase/transposase/recombinase (plasmid) [Jannaschia sp. W003]|nr:DDE-type integrase/transposase/recombinase [Jannaschia sp. W003]UWQ23096.1 DDE-type integrase/transposase/recombinase [Jannaschia sp. W003]
MAHLREAHGVSQRQACAATGLDRSSIRYRSVRTDDAEAKDSMKAVAAERRRFGYRKIYVMLDRRGITMNLKTLWRPCREEGLQVRKRGSRKRALGARRPMVVLDGPNRRWPMDFVSDAFTDGRRFRLLTVVDDSSRECLALVADTSLSGARVARGLDGIITVRGRPATAVSDNGAEFNPTAILNPVLAHRDRLASAMSLGPMAATSQTIAPGKPTRDTPSSRASRGACATRC